MFNLGKAALIFVLSAALVGCGACGGRDNQQEAPVVVEEERRETIWDLFNSADENTTVKVNKYLWAASLETLSFLPVESADPFTGVITFGYGRAPGSSRAIRATVLIQDPALDPRSLKVSLQTRGGPASAEMIRAVENAILTRARQLRIRDSGL